MRIIEDEFELPAPDFERGGEFRFVRSQLSPTTLIDGMTGETYTRRDGKPWEWPGYKIKRDYKTDRVEREPAIGPEDGKQIKAKASAA